VAVPGVEVRTEAVEVEQRLRRRVRAVDDDRQSLRVRAGDDRVDGQEKAGVRGDVADEDDAGALGTRREQRLDHVFRPRDRQ
jgi:hypothetical protein